MQQCWRGGVYTKAIRTWGFAVLSGCFYHNPTGLLSPKFCQATASLLITDPILLYHLHLEHLTPSHPPPT